MMMNYDITKDPNFIAAQIQQLAYTVQSVGAKLYLGREGKEVQLIIGSPCNSEEEAKALYEELSRILRGEK